MEIVPPVKPSKINGLVYFLCGILTGSVVAMIFVTYLINQGKVGKKKSNKQKGIELKKTELKKCP